MNWLDEQAESSRRRADALDAMAFIGYGIVLAILVALVRQIAEVAFP